MLCVLLLIAACESTPTPSPQSPSVGPRADIPLACWSVGNAECVAIYQAALSRLEPGVPVVAAQVIAYGCESGPCAPGVEARGQGQVQLETGNGMGLLGWELTLAGGGGLAFSPPTQLAARGFSARSARGAPLQASLSLGHCGLYSPIDYDGSLWDLTGPVDGDAAEAINSAAGTIRLLGPIDAEFRTPSGFAVRLRRHAGPKVFQGCA